MTFGESEPVGGNFTLVLRKIDGRWMIVHDHTSPLGEWLAYSHDGGAQ